MKLLEVKVISQSFNCLKERKSTIFKRRQQNSKCLYYVNRNAQYTIPSRHAEKQEYMTHGDPADFEISGYIVFRLYIKCSCRPYESIKLVLKCQQIEFLQSMPSDQNIIILEKNNIKKSWNKLEKIFELHENKNIVCQLGRLRIKQFVEKSSSFKYLQYKKKKVLKSIIYSLPQETRKKRIINPS